MSGVLDAFLRINPLPWKAERAYPISGREEWVVVDANGASVPSHSGLHARRQEAEAYAALSEAFLAAQQEITALEEQLHMLEWEMLRAAPQTPSEGGSDG